MKIIRKICGAIIVFFDAISRPKPMQRSEEAQKDVDQRTQNLALYQFHGCPFCVKVRRSLHKLNLNVELRDAQTEQFGQELLKEGGKRKVPCLRIQENGQVQWMYDSKVIIDHLEKSFNH